MLAKTPERHIILIRETVKESVLIDGGTFLMVCGIILVSYMFDSQAMGWFGFILLCLLVLARSAGQHKRLTIAEARAELDRIQSEM